MPLNFGEGVTAGRAVGDYVFEELTFLKYVFLVEAGYSEQFSQGCLIATLLHNGWVNQIPLSVIKRRMLSLVNIAKAITMNSNFYCKLKPSIT